MRYAIIENGAVANVAVAESPLAQNWVEAPAQVGPGWLYDWSEFSPPPPPEPDPAELIDTYRRAVQAHVDATAQAREYRSGDACVSYVDDPNPSWDAEGRAFRVWRSLVWSYVNAFQAQVQAGTAPMPETPEALIAMLPEIEWP
jgi:hypothetical protein